MADQFTFKRIEKKYLLNTAQYNELMERIRDLAAIDDYGETSILNIYYDTKNYSLIRKSLEKPLYKEKLRLRTYGTPDSDTKAFIELKKKYKGVVYKRRIEAPYDEAKDSLLPGNPPVQNSQIGREIDYFKSMYPGIAPRMVISYDRIALAGIKDENLRLTFDKNLRYRTLMLDLKYGNAGKSIMDEGSYLLEIKAAGAMPIELAEALSDLKIFPVSFSKYGRAFSKCILSGEISIAGEWEYIDTAESFSYSALDHAV